MNISKDEFVKLIEDNFHDWRMAVSYFYNYNMVGTGWYITADGSEYDDVYFRSDDGELIRRSDVEF